MGFTANSFSSLSLDPPLVLWSIARASRRFRVFAEAERFAIHILGQDKTDWPARFGRDGEGFAGLDMARWNGVPVLPDALARFDCDRHTAYDGGDHLIIVGHVRQVTSREGAPLVFAQGRYGAVSPVA
jgi:flavin reductase (DIM6/NTAB) family NADH-FMN oxidoreductase RutF